ncbi:uncharacterized protein LOC128929027 isoform X6 [Callithrix jacchus]
MAFRKIDNIFPLQPLPLPKAPCEKQTPQIRREEDSRWRCENNPGLELALNPQTEPPELLSRTECTDPSPVDQRETR